MEKQQTKIEEEFQRFIEFGNVLDKQGRKYFIAYLQDKLGAEKTEITELKEGYFKYFRSSLDDLFDDEELKNLAKSNQTLSSQIVADTVQWFRKAYKEVSEKHPYEDEQQELGSWGVRHMRQFVKSWQFLIQKVGSFYIKEEIDVSFHQQKFKNLIKDRSLEELSEQEIADIERVYLDLLAQWDARLEAKILNFQLKKLTQQKEEFKDKLAAKAEEYKKITSLVSPFTDYIGRYWDMSRALWQDSTFDIIEKYDQLLEDEEQLRKLAELLGRLRQAEIETEEETLEKVIVRKEWVKDPNLKSEIVGVRSGDDLNNVLPSEIALFGEDTEWQFLKRFADQQLMVNRYEDRKLISSNKIFSETFQRVKQKEKGPFIVCVDTSGSMEGEPERIAKVLCFAILKMAAEDRRQAFLINFSSGIHTIDLYNLVDSIDEVAAFLQKSFLGGTDISLALSEALMQLETHRYRDADVLIISDFIMYKISDDLLQRMEKQQHNHATQFHSLIITDQANEEVISQFDNVWSYNPDEKNIVKELYGKIEQLSKRKL